MRLRRSPSDPLDALPAELVMFDPAAWVGPAGDVLEARRRWAEVRRGWCRDHGADMVELLRRDRAARRRAHGWQA